MKDINNEFVDIVNFCLDDVDEIGNDILLEKYGLKIDLIYVDRDKGVEEPCLSYLSIS